MNLFSTKGEHGVGDKMYIILVHYRSNCLKRLRNILYVSPAKKIGVNCGKERTEVLKNIASVILLVLFLSQIETPENRLTLSSM